MPIITHEAVVVAHEMRTVTRRSHGRANPRR